MQAKKQEKTVDFQPNDDLIHRIKNSNKENPSNFVTDYNNRLTFLKQMYHTFLQLQNQLKMLSKQIKNENDPMKGFIVKSIVLADQELNAIELTLKEINKLYNDLFPEQKETET